ncbi:MAG TPA: phenylalanine--tRNA ligase subunit alpha [candidate division Zixibacteria bacterium]|nr:phenylalanine--tRNA ligase subunit alpha [candidate division Zixibacteria bacterium]
MSLLDDVQKLKSEALERIGLADSLEVLNDLKVEYLGRKGRLTAILKGLKDLTGDERKEVGAEANQLRSELEGLIKESWSNLEKASSTNEFDPTLPGTIPRRGAMHLLNQTLADICEVFHGMGFEIAYGPDVETDYYNFEALNFKPDHPARDMQDTLFVEGGRVLRTHTTPVQARMLEKRKPPIKMITPGMVFRNEAISTRSHVAFHQVDGFLVDEGVTLSDMKGALVAFCRAYFGPGLKLKFRPSYFPFTEPSAEVDIQCFLCRGKGCRVCKQSGWLEILGCGMIHPNVLENAGIDSEKYSGYAFGTGVARPAMLKYRINDIRLFFNNDIRFLRQFL